MRRLFYGLVLMSLLSSSLSASDKLNQDAVAAKLREAAKKTNIFELPSFRMTADITLAVDGSSANGTYTLLWNGPDQWREEIELSKYTEIQIGGRGATWVR